MFQVIGDLIPDSDAICTAYMTARKLNMCREEQAGARRLGEASSDTRFIFECVGLESYLLQVR